jgi:hypothetical protein
MELGWLGTLIDVLTVLLESVITSIRLAVKLAMYNTPRTGSSAISAASPPIGTTVPNVPAPTEAAVIAIIAILANAEIQCLRNIRKLHVYLFKYFAPESTGNIPNNKYAARGLLPRIAGTAGPRDPKKKTLRPNRSRVSPEGPDYSSTFFLRRNTMIPRNRIASTAQTIRTIELSMSFSFPDNIKFGFFSPNL